MADHGKRLLVLDDDEMTGNTIGFVAQSAGIDARVTTSPDSFFEQLAGWQPTHIALDLVMPEMDGVQVMVELASHECAARIIITSGVGSRVLDAAGRSAREHGLDIIGVLSKPFSPAELRNLLEDDRETDSTDSKAPAGPTPAADSNMPDESELRAGIENGEIVTWYQPKIHCASGRLAGFEALARWQHPKRGLLAPFYFISLAERTGLIEPLTRRILEDSLGWFAETFAQDEARSYGVDRASITLSVNFSARSLDDDAFIDQILDRCERLGVQPEQLVFELTETSAMENPVTSLNQLTRLRMKGFQLSIDDFGTGYSSMLQLVRLPFSEIKVDRSFVMTANRSDESRAVIRSIVDLGASLGLRSTAEGVEDQKTLDFLRQIGCDQAQGYFMSRPVPGDRAFQWALENAANPVR